MKLRFYSFLVYATALSSLSAFGANPSSTQISFCQDRQNALFVKELAQEADNRMAFRNKGGIGNGGVCWWHSRFQRNALYLTIFNPEAEKPTVEEGVSIIKKIRAGKEIVEIPGYNNFYDFSYEFQMFIQDELESWQRSDGAKFAWIRGLKGSAVVSPEKMKSLMDELYTEVEINGNIAYQKLQVKGITAHAWLVVNMVKEEDGYSLEVIDSNYPRMTMLYRYQEGDTNFTHGYYGEFTPYLEETKEMQRIAMTISQTCNQELLSKK